MPKSTDHALSRRERQIMDIVYARGEATAREVLDAMADPPSYSAVRALLRILARKGHLKHRRDGARYLHSPTKPRRREARSALRRAIDTFFDGSIETAFAGLLDLKDRNLSDDELDRLSRMIEQARSTKGGH